MRILGLCSSTPRGDGNPHAEVALLVRGEHGLCSSTPRGDGNHDDESPHSSYESPWFMQLNPARGRKHGHAVPHRRRSPSVYAAQPREGTETTIASAILSRSRPWFMHLNPARGRRRAPTPLSGHGAALDSHAHDDTPPCSSPVAAPHAQHISSFLMGGLW